MMLTRADGAHTHVGIPRGCDGSEWNGLGLATGRGGPECTPTPRARGPADHTEGAVTEPRSRATQALSGLADALGPPEADVLAAGTVLRCPECDALRHAPPLCGHGLSTADEPPLGWTCPVCGHGCAPTMEWCPCARTEHTSTELTGATYDDPEEATVSATCDALGLTGYGRTEAEAVTMLAEDLVAVWTEIVMEPDSELSPVAIRLKYRLREAITIRHERGS